MAEAEEKDEDDLAALAALSDALGDKALRAVAEALHHVRFGEIKLVVVSGRVVEVDYVKKVRL